MKKLSPASTRRCSWCSTRAEWQTQTLTFEQKHACPLHRPMAAEHEAKNQDSGHMTEADRQTWGRLR